MISRALISACRWRHSTGRRTALHPRGDRGLALLVRIEARLQGEDLAVPYLVGLPRLVRHAFALSLVACTDIDMPGTEQDSECGGGLAALEWFP